VHRFERPSARLGGVTRRGLRPVCGPGPRGARRKWRPPRRQEAKGTNSLEAGRARRSLSQES
jgi:hypothetical protein